METRQKKTKRLVNVLALAGLLAVSLLCVAGDLEPSGPPGPTMKTLDEVEPRIPISSLPYTISESGSYYFTGDLTTTGSGIIVEANDVSINLMGYQLIGQPTVAYDGISISHCSNVEIRNGTVRSFGAVGICDSAGRGHRIIGMRVVSNGDNGINLAGSGHLVQDCTTAANADAGIAVADDCRVTENIAYDNGAHGICAGKCCTVTANTVLQNNQSDMSYWSGIRVNADCMVKDNTVVGNKQNNIYVYGDDNAIEQNLVTDSSGTGIYFKSSGNFYANNRASGNGTDYANTAGQTDGGGNVSF